MATKRQSEEQDRASNNRRNEAVGNIIANTEGGYGSAIGTLAALIEAIDSEENDIRELRRKGWQTGAAARATAAADVRFWRDLLVAYTPPAGRPAPAAIAVDHRADTPAELDARLEAAFQIPTPVRHVMTVLERPMSEGVEAPDETPVKGALCGSTKGSWTHRGGANCETCIAIYDNEHGPYAGPTAFNGGDPQPGDLAQAFADATPAVIEYFESVGLPPGAADLGNEVGDKVTVGGIEFTKHSEWPRESDGSPSPGTLADVLSLNIVDPSPRAPVRQRMTLADVRTVGLARQRGLEHRSVSQVTGYSDCGTRYALSHMEAPAWWNVGGKALHRCVESINRVVAEGGALFDSTSVAESMWLQAFDAEIADQHAASPEWPMSTWRGAKKGSEAYDWWRVEGPPMVEKYVTWLRGMLADGWKIARTRDGRPVVELEVTTDVGAAVPNLSIIDFALVHVLRDLLLVVDVKAGASAPKDTFQLGVYGWALLGVLDRQGSINDVRGAYYRARTGELVPDPTHAGHALNPGWPILSMHGWPDVVQRYRDMDAMERQGFYQPNVTTFCGGCGVKDICPAHANG